MSETTPPSAWKPLIDEWVERERQLRPHLPVRDGSVRVRDAVEIGDQAFVLLSFDVEHPWPAEEEAGTGSHTAVLQAERVRRPWHERDATRASSAWRDEEAQLSVHEHMLGSRRVFSGQVDATSERVSLHFVSGAAHEARVVDGWFLAVVEDDEHLEAMAVDGASKVSLRRDDVDSLLTGTPFSRDVADAMYFSPLDLRSVLPIVQWERSGDVVAVATCLEQYDEGGMLRLRIDGVRVDDDTFVSWPSGILAIDGREIDSSVCGESALADTLSLDIGFRPWLPTSARELTIRIDGVRGADGEIGPITLTVRIPGR